ncbi:MAG: phosphatase PAP2 family protein [Anaerolineae bacterium]|nr:MAG: phosphatase PAP2 family protein [Anaerolineae bacterium]
MNFETLLARDAALSNRLRVAEQPGPLRNIAILFGHSGDSWFWLAGLLLTGWLGSPIWKTRAAILFVSILVTALLVLALKFAIRRRRPEGEWGQMYRKTDPHSFPSGHAARGMMLGVVAFGLGPAWFGWLLLVWGPLVGPARIAMGVHYVSDVLAGWIVGLGMGLAILGLVGQYL